MQVRAETYNCKVQKQSLVRRAQSVDQTQKKMTGKKWHPELPSPTLAPPLSFYEVARQFGHEHDIASE